MSGNRMASPQVENGFMKLSFELLEALTAYRIPGEQMQCLLFILRKTYGWDKKCDAISLSQFVKATGIKKSHVSRALIALKNKRIIRGANIGDTLPSIYGINKDYTEWQVSPIKGISPKKATGIPNIGNKVSPKKGTTTDTTTETRQQIKRLAAFPQKDGEKTVTPEPFYLTKKKRKLKGWKLETFEQFWKTFHWFKDKANAADAWLQIPGLTKDLALKQIIPAAARYCEGRADLIAGNHTPKWAQGWLSSRRWEDEKYEDEKDGLNNFLRRHGKTNEMVQ